MKIFIETDRLILREILPSDDVDMFRLDSDPDVHRYLGGKPLTDIEESREVIASVRQQYLDYGIGRWAMIERATGEFMGWTGLKFCTEMRNDHINYYDVGYRMIPKYWGKGYATESAIASLEYGFKIMNLAVIYGTADLRNLASRHVLEKIGLRHIGEYEYEGTPSAWLKITKEEWLATQA
jgi:ribosomal-protein-alanine N-acetyltransferase